MKLQRILEAKFKAIKYSDVFDNSVRVIGTLYANGSELTSLEGVPEIINGDCMLHGNYLESLKFSPKQITGDCFLNNNKLKNLEGVTPIIGGDLICSFNKLTSVKGAPTRINKDFFLTNNNLSSLEGMPTYIGGTLNLSNNKFESLHDIHKHIEHLNTIMISGNPLTSHVLGLLKIPSLRRVYVKQFGSIAANHKSIADIINRHLQSPPGNARVFACQGELLDAGYDAFAQL